MKINELKIESRIALIKAYAQLLNKEIEELENYCRQAKAANSKEGVYTSSDRKAHLERLGAEAVAKRELRLKRKGQ